MVLPSVLLAVLPTRSSCRVLPRTRPLGQHLYPYPVRHSSAHQHQRSPSVRRIRPIPFGGLLQRGRVSRNPSRLQSPPAVTSKAVLQVPGRPSSPHFRAALGARPQETLQLVVVSMSLLAETTSPSVHTRSATVSERSVLSPSKPDPSAHALVPAARASTAPSQQARPPLWPSKDPPEQSRVPACASATPAACQDQRASVPARLARGALRTAVGRTPLSHSPTETIHTVAVPNRVDIEDSRRPSEPVPQRPSQNTATHVPTT